MLAQNKSNLKGVVVDIDGVPVVGVTVFVEGTTNGTMTDGSGSYVLEGIKSGNKVLFECIGYQPVEYIWNGTDVSKNVVMRIDDVVLDEVVVVGYGVQKKVSVTGAMSSVAPITLESKPAGKALCA